MGLSKAPHETRPLPSLCPFLVTVGFGYIPYADRFGEPCGRMRLIRPSPWRQMLV